MTLLVLNGMILKKNNENNWISIIMEDNLSIFQQFQYPKQVFFWELVDTYCLFSYDLKEEMINLFHFLESIIYQIITQDKEELTIEKLHEWFREQELDETKKQKLKKIAIELSDFVCEIFEKSKKKIELEYLIEKIIKEQKKIDYQNIPKFSHNLQEYILKSFAYKKEIIQILRACIDREDIFGEESALSLNKFLKNLTSINVTNNEEIFYYNSLNKDNIDILYQGKFNFYKKFKHSFQGKRLKKYKNHHLIIKLDLENLQLK